MFVDLAALSKASPIHAHHPTRPQHKQSNGHLDAVLDNIQLAAAHLVPLNGHLGDLDARTGPNDAAVAAQDGCSGRGLGEHQHLNVEDPALSMHVRDNVRQRGARKELEAALGIANPGRGRGGEDGEHEVERAHEKVSKSRALKEKGKRKRGIS